MELPWSQLPRSIDRFPIPSESSSEYLSLDGDAPTAAIPVLEAWDRPRRMSRNLQRSPAHNAIRDERLSVLAPALPHSAEPISSPQSRYSADLRVPVPSPVVDPQSPPPRPLRPPSLINSPSSEISSMPIQIVPPSLVDRRSSNDSLSHPSAYPPDPQISPPPPRRVLFEPTPQQPSGYGPYSYSPYDPWSHPAFPEPVLVDPQRLAHPSVTESSGRSPDLEVPQQRCNCYRISPESGVNRIARGQGRNLVVAFDGTENQYGPQSSHVVEFYSRVIKNSNQLAYYSSGIGTYVKPSRTARVRTFVKNKWASLTAWNFKVNLLAGYRWLAEHYEDGDRIYLLGFSRGGYQARVLAAMIGRIGLISTGNEEQIPFAFDVYKDPRSYETLQVGEGQDRMDTTPASQFKRAFCRDVNIHFVGVWDAVSSVGIFRSKDYPGARQATNVCFFRQALALDERRVKFLPEYVEAPAESFKRRPFELPHCKEVWFRGSHSDVGGGNRKNPNLTIGGVPSRWMAFEAMLAGLQMEPFPGRWSQNEITARRPKNSMSPFYLILEYIPLLPPIQWIDTSIDPCGRPTRKLHRQRPRNIQAHQKLHVTVGTCGYSPQDQATLAALPVAYEKTQWPELCVLLQKAQDDHARSDSSLVSTEAGTTMPPSVRRIVRHTSESIHSRASSRSAFHFPYGHDEESAPPPDQNRVAFLEQSEPVPNHVSLPEQTETYPADVTSLFELDWYDFENIPFLISSIKDGSNVVDFLERLILITPSSDARKVLRAFPNLSTVLFISMRISERTMILGFRLAAKLWNSVELARRHHSVEDWNTFRDMIRSGKLEENSSLLDQAINVFLGITERARYSRELCGFILEDLLHHAESSLHMVGLRLGCEAHNVLYEVTHLFHWNSLKHIQKACKNALESSHVSDKMKLQVTLLLLDSLTYQDLEVFSSAKRELLLTGLEHLEKLPGIFESQSASVLPKLTRSHNFRDEIASRPELLKQMLDHLYVTAVSEALLALMQYADCAGRLLSVGLVILFRQTEKESSLKFLSLVIEQQPSLVLQHVRVMDGQVIESAVEYLLRRCSESDCQTSATVMFKILVPLCLLGHVDFDQVRKKLIMFALNHDRTATRTAALCLLVLCALNDSVKTECIESLCFLKEALSLSTSDNFFTQLCLSPSDLVHFVTAECNSWDHQDWAIKILGTFGGGSFPLPSATSMNRSGTPYPFRPPSVGSYYASPDSPPYGSYYAPLVPPTSLEESTIKKKQKNLGAADKVLTETYNRTAFPSTEECFELAKALDMTPKSVRRWRVLFWHPCCN